MVNKFEDYFNYFWAHDKNYAIQSEEDMRFMKELPKVIRRDIYKDFLFKDFLYLFKTHFRLVKEDIALGKRLVDISVSKIEITYWSWEDNAYQQFMIKTL